MEQTFLKNQLLIAMPSMVDPHFARTVTYICEHTEDGAMGLVLNRPLGITLGDIFEQMDIESDNKATNEQVVFFGGPVGSEQGFVLHEPGKTWEGTYTNSDEIAITASKDILLAIAKGEGPEKQFISLGYAGWDAGQLEQELSENMWLTVPLQADIIFKLPLAQRWSAAAASLGFELSNLSSDVGHD